MDISPQPNPSNPTQADNPENQDVSSTPTGEEVALAQWQESEHIKPVFPFGGITGLATIASLIILVLIVLGVWQHDFNFYFIAGVILIASASLIIQMRRDTPRLNITLTDRRLIVGNRQYLLSDVAGFWPQHDDATLAINIEMKKPGLLPVTFLYQNDNIDEVREVLGQVLPELEPRVQSSMDRVSRYFRF